MSKLASSSMSLSSSSGCPVVPNSNVLGGGMLGSTTIRPLVGVESRKGVTAGAVKLALSPVSASKEYPVDVAAEATAKDSFDADAKNRSVGVTGRREFLGAVTGAVVVTERKDSFDAADGIGRGFLFDTSVMLKKCLDTAYCVLRTAYCGLVK